MNQIIKRIFKNSGSDKTNRRNSKFLTFNKAVNFEKQSIFIGIPKTGTTSIQTQLSPQGKPFIPSGHLSIIQIRDTLYTWFLYQALGKNKSFPTESVPSNADIRAQAEDVFDTFFKFASVRNPWARAVSLYFRREGVKLKRDNKYSFEAFCENHFYASDTCKLPTLHKNQLDWLCDENGQCLMDYIYKLEDYDQAMVEIKELTNGRLQLASNNQNRNPESPSKSYREFYTDETRKIIATRFEKDIDHFKYTF